MHVPCRRRSTEGVGAGGGGPGGGVKKFQPLQVDALDVYLLSSTTLSSALDKKKRCHRADKKKRKVASKLQDEST